MLVDMLTSSNIRNRRIAARSGMTGKSRVASNAATAQCIILAVCRCQNMFKVWWRSDFSAWICDSRYLTTSTMEAAAFATAPPSVVATITMIIAPIVVIIR